MLQRPGTDRCTAALGRVDLRVHRLPVECGNVCTPTLALLLSLVNSPPTLSPMMVPTLAHTTIHPPPVLVLVTPKLTAMAQTVKTTVPPLVLMMLVLMMMLTNARITTSNSGEPLRGRAFRSNLRFAPISSAIPLASAPFGRCALRLPETRTGRAAVRDTVPDSVRRTSCLAGAGCAAHRLAHSAVHRCPHQCGHHRRHSRRRAAHDLPHYPRHFRPLNRRGGSDQPPSTATISRTLMQQAWPSRPPGAALGLTPDAPVVHGAQRCLRLVFDALAHDPSHSRPRLSCRKQCVAFATNKGNC
ncbi:MAG: hypothetical protein OXE57_18760 [Alphaproteobacteria bacterium]|nr:hypothetical protein [Alphaproteobacteria bacterium]